MLQALTSLKIMDNSGGREAHCIKVLKNQRWASLGDVVVVSLRKVRKIHNKYQLRKVALGKIYRLLILQVKKERQRFDGSVIRFSSNAGVLLTRQSQPVGTRIKGSLPHELRNSPYLKTMSLGSNLI
jgi:large subunit ribosomal protein L14